MIDLIINPDSIRVSKSEVSTQIFSEIYFQIGNIFFPDKKWDDFTVIILNWWLREACKIKKNNIAKKNNVAHFSFMDGPFYFEVHFVGETCNIEFIDNRYDKKEVVYSGKIECTYLFNLLKKNANLLIRNIPSEAEKLKDVIEIKKSLKLIQKHVKYF
ncbi:hypothetical protein [Gilliamella sp. Occ4-3]|uniref:hypothetical protein n=1 Tax=Gilliamella sp. Occ4-3 TaxID=3120254 RepID=UPI00080E6F55|nr:hypothetical protein [Gilliamella apicola]OCG74006.1 hypothetical protein A9G44_08435 [Gilliamella apicola]